MLALPGRGVHKHQVGAQSRQGADLVGLKQADGHDAVQLLPSCGYHKLTAPVFQGHCRISLVQAALAHKSAQIQVIWVVQLLHRGEHLCDANPQHALGGASPSALGLGVVQPPRLLQYLPACLGGDGKLWITGQNPGDGGGRVAGALCNFFQRCHGLRPLSISVKIILSLFCPVGNDLFTGIRDFLLVFQILPWLLCRFHTTKIFPFPRCP